MLKLKHNGLTARTNSKQVYPNSSFSCDLSGFLSYLNLDFTPCQAKNVVSRDEGGYKVSDTFFSLPCMGGTQKTVYCIECLCL